MTSWRIIAALGVAGAAATAALACTGDDPELATSVDGGGSEASSSSTSSSSSSSGATVTQDTGADSPAPVKTCPRTGIFGTASLLANLSDGVNLLHPRLTPDEKEIFYQHGPNAIYHAERSDPTLAFGQPLPLPLGDASLQDPAISDDTLALYVSINYRIARLTRANRGAEFGSPMFIELGADPDTHEVDPHVLANESALYFTRVIPDAGRHIWRSQGDEDGGFAAPVPVDLGPDSYTNPSVSDDELEIYVQHFSTSTIHRATRGSDAEAFPTPTPVDDLNSQAQLDGNPRPGWLSPDGCRLYFAAGSTVSKLWMAERQPQ